MKDFFKNYSIWEFLCDIIPILDIFESLDNDSGRIVSKKGESIIRDPVKMKKVNKALEDVKRKGEGHVYVDFY